MSRPVQLALFGRQSVHVGHWSRAAGLVACVMCGVSLAMSAVYDDCSSCRGLVEPVPAGTVLGGSGVPDGHLPLVAAKEAA